MATQVEELQASNARMRKDLITCLGAKGSITGSIRPAGPQAPLLLAMETSHELKSQVQRLRRELAEHRRKVWRIYCPAIPPMKR